MKKQYIIPVIQAVKIQPYVLQAASQKVYNDNVNNVNDLLSRGFDFGDDEDED